MSRRITIHEFESISQSKFGDDPCGDFAALERLILENQGRGTDPIELLSLSVKRGIGKVVTARNHVGIIAFRDGVELEILPKIGSVIEDDDPDGTARRTFIRMLKTVFDLPFKEFDIASMDSERMPVFEFFIRMFVRETDALLRNGLSSTYYEVRGNEPFLKGRVDFSENIRMNIVRKERFFVEYQTYGLDRPENRLIRSTLEHLYTVSRDHRNRRGINRLLHEMEAIPSSTNVEGDFSKVCIDRNMSGYRRMMKWCEVFLRNRSFTTFSGHGIAYSFLFPMDRLYEAYVAKVLEKNLRGVVTVRSQDASEHLFDNSRRFRLRPDIILETGDRRIVVDTKWKLLSSERDIVGSDMYQMFVYSKKFDASKVILLYPKTSMVETSLEDRENNVNVDVCFVDMVEPEGSLKGFGERVLKELEIQRRRIYTFMNSIF